MTSFIKHFYDNPPKAEWSKILARPNPGGADISALVADILAAVKEKGDQAIIDFNTRFDGFTSASFEVTEEEIKEAVLSLPENLKNAIQSAAANITAFHEMQKVDQEPVETMPGVLCWRKSLPIEKVGLYIPGGTAPLFSSVLMLGIPAKIAGCSEIILCSPPQKDGKIHPAILFAAHITGITRIFKVGGAQAIAAMAFGTEIIPAVYKIAGPGNRYVTEAKQSITKFGVAIDMPAGPSEVLVFADEGANPAFVAADLLSQAEHGEDSQVVLICPDKMFFEKVDIEIGKQLTFLPRMEIAKKALQNSVAIAVNDASIAMDLINDYAPEHLIMALRNPIDFVNDIRNAGSVFLGDYTPEAVGDYASGTNHTLPTNGFARAFSGVSVDSFIKKITFQQVSQSGLTKLGPIVMTMAEAERLEAHKQAVSIRLDNLQL
ncbi:MAG: histidinol dehydrogenase [Haliscomenobacter sp.]|nr:histidinol dehydrogenase [Haliscomenobacter sp.]